MTRARFFFAVAILMAVGAGMMPPGATADSHPYRLHVQGRLGSAHSSAVDIDVPWDSDKKGSPFDFTADACDDLQLEALRSTWTTLKKSPEGRTVRIENKSETMLASRSAGFLVLEPLPAEDKDDHHTRVKIPDYIVNTIIDNDGRLTDRDIERLLHERGKVTLVKINSDQGGLSVWIDRAGKDTGRGD